MPTPRTASRIPSLDGLRAVSILLVLWCHASGMRGYPRRPGWERWLGGFGFSHGEFGVSIFFVISGYLITTLLMKERDKTGRISLGRFYVRRALRIFPAAYFYLLVITALDWHVIPKGQLLAGWLYVEDFVRNPSWNVLHLWSLGVEEQFYLLWPVALVLFWKKKEKIAIGSILAAVVSRAIFHFAGWSDLTPYAFPCVQDALAAGCLLAMWRDRIPTRWVDQWILPILLLVLAANEFHMRAGLYELLVQTPRNLGIALLVDHCMRKEYRVLNWRPVVWLGTISYSLYLWQMPFTEQAGPGNPRDIWITFPYNIGFALAMGCVSYYLVERPVLRLRDRFLQKPYADVKAEPVIAN